MDALIGIIHREKSYILEVNKKHECTDFKLSLGFFILIATSKRSFHSPTCILKPQSQLGTQKNAFSPTSKAVVVTVKQKTIVKECYKLILNSCKLMFNKQTSTRDSFSSFPLEHSTVL